MFDVALFASHFSRKVGSDVAAGWIASSEGGIYTTSGFCKKFMPPEKRNPKGAYQGPKYFTFKGEPLTDLRAKLGK